MRILLVTRGLPASGKSSWIKENNLSLFTLSPDALRILAQSPTQCIDGSLSVSQKNDSFIWDFFYKLLESRLKNGDFTIIDATNTVLNNLKIYQKLCQQYAYEMHIVDFTDVSLEECQKRNLLRRQNGKFFVPNETLVRMHKQLKNNPLPHQYSVIHRKNWRQVLYSPMDLNAYEKIYHIGDLQGCYSVLKNLGEIQPQNFYIFLGDYIDRGIENAEVLKYLLSICNLPNVYLIEGNHERHLRTYARGEESQSSEFNLNTKVQIEENSLSRQDINYLCSQLKTLIVYSYGDKQVFCNHCGMPNFPSDISQLSFIPSSAMIHGIGNYSDTALIAEYFYQNTHANLYQIFGHRNRQNLPTQINSRVFVCENKVEFGGYLRVVTLDCHGFECLEFKNEVFKQSSPIVSTQVPKSPSNVCELLKEFRKSQWVQEKQFGHISSFRFSREAFSKKNWDTITCKARGLFLDTQNFSIVARSYDKFFNLNEQDALKLNSLQQTLKFPLQTYIKENGFLGIIAFHNNSLFISSKSDWGGIHSKHFAHLIKQLDVESKILYFLSKNINYSLVFEVIDPIFDPHIIEYHSPKIVLLDAVENSLIFYRKSYEDLQNIANEIGVPCKRHFCSINDFQTLESFLVENSSGILPHSEAIEGFVIEDTESFMFKVKGSFYVEWKQKRSAVHHFVSQIQKSKNQAKYIQTLLSKCQQNPFLEWYFKQALTILEMGNLQDFLGKNIIDLRNLFLKNQH
ncbi:RNA ligase [Helicobacter monodelphidis]|uniref:RNA ligase n=1 Tax=Helicobacter sp. 15-1451 TaxID=2004995 RepID=UPI0011BF70BB|nr:RNA ligase [Helicobacter sp. 15-1451]